jgi:hypothetical protein
MSGFEHITEVLVPAEIAQEANFQLRQIGQRGLEGFSLWAGEMRGTSFFVRVNIVPAQTGHRSESGVCVSVGPQELHRINMWLYENRMSIIVQIHTHPTDAYHSETDDAFPIATTNGCISIVIPNFARQPFALHHCAVYRLKGQAGWVELSPQETFNLIRIINQ